MLDPLIRYFKRFLCVHKPTVYRPPDIVRIFFVLVSSFASIIALEGTFKYGPAFIKHHTPEIVPSWAATIILTCNALESPLGQPFPQFFGTILSSILGIGLTKIWTLDGRNEETLWVCGALALALSSIMMTRFKIVHPAAGSAALLAAINPQIRAMGWFYLVVQIVTAIIVIGVGSIFGNLYAQYPLYWTLPPKLSEAPSSPLKPVNQEKLDLTASSSSSSSRSSADMEPQPLPVPITASDNSSLYSLSQIPTAKDDGDADIGLAPLQHRPTLASSLGHTLSQVITDTRYLTRIVTRPETTNWFESQLPSVDLQTSAVITSSEVSFPSELTFSSDERGILISIQRKLAALEEQGTAHS